MLPLRRRERVLGAVLLVLAGTWFWTLASYSSRGTSTAIISLATSSMRIDYELPLTLLSLSQQSVSPAKVHIYMPKEEEAFLKKEIAFRPLLQTTFIKSKCIFHFEQDIGPASKYFWTIRDLVKSDRDQGQPIIVVDDDHFYSPLLVETLMKEHTLHPNVSIGLRGWRVNSDLTWGVTAEESRYHIVQGYDLARPYRASVLTANEGYLILPRFFSADADFFDLSALTTTSSHLVDDIYMAAQLSRLNISRYIVPLPIPSWDLTKSHTLETHIRKEGYSRKQANDETLARFSSHFKAEGLFYMPHNGQALVKGVLRRGSNFPVMVSPTVQKYRRMKQLSMQARVKLWEQQWL